ncbi:tetratricopeptide repeat protein [Nitrospira defluvii]|nr:tetratricopeptide repeat protein [Nitrospira defluvii]
MKRKSTFRFGVFVVGITTILTFSACTGGGSTAPQIPSIMSPTGMSNTDAASKNNEGVDHLVQGHWDVAIKHLSKAIAAKSNFAEAHFNMAVALDGKGKHADATASFKKAQEFGADNPKITESTILKKHLNM